MLSGTFEVGETVTGTVVQTGLGPDTKAPQQASPLELQQQITKKVLIISQLKSIQKIHMLLDKIYQQHILLHQQF